MTTGRASACAAVLLLLACTWLAAGPAGAQVDDPYGSTTTTTAAPDEMECTLSTESARPGTRVDGEVSGAVEGTETEINFGGRVVYRTTVDEDGHFTFSFVVPGPPGRYDVVAVSTAASATCSDDFVVTRGNSGRGPGDPDVEGDTATPGQEGSGGSGGNGADEAVSSAGGEPVRSDGGLLALTGLGLLRLIALALVLIAIGFGVLRYRRARLDASVV